jgi:hypothetical protein
MLPAAFGMGNGGPLIMLMLALPGIVVDLGCLDLEPANDLRTDLRWRQSSSNVAR